MCSCHLCAHPPSDDVLLEVCRVSPEDVDAMPVLLDELRWVRQLIPPPQVCHDGRLEHLMALLSSALGRMAQYNPTHLPFGFAGPTITSSGWLNRDALELVAKQIIGLTWIDIRPDSVDSAVVHGVSQAISFGLIEKQRYDSWRPGMARGSGWRDAVRTTTYGMTRARVLVEKHLTPQPTARSSPVCHTQRTDDTKSAAPCNAMPTPAPAVEDTQEHVASVGTEDATPASGFPVVLGGKGRPCFVLGNRKPPLSDVQHDIVESLIKEPNGLSKDALENVRPSARRALKELAQSDGDWARVIFFPPTPGLRYRIVSPE